MKLGVMQPYLFPYLGYFQCIYSVDKYIIYDNVAYIKQGWMNRNRYLPKNQKPKYFIVPVINRSSFKMSSEIELVEDPSWRTTILQSIYLSYKNRPFFEETYPIVESVFTANLNHLSQLNILSIIKISKHLDIETEISTDTGNYLQLESDLDEDSSILKLLYPSLKLGNLDKRTIRVIVICQNEGADIYINAIGGQELYSKADFEQNGINLFFLKMNEHSYPQGSDLFYPNLSIIDVLMNIGKIETIKLLNEYTLV